MNTFSPRGALTPQASTSGSPEPAHRAADFDTHDGGSGETHSPAAGPGPQLSGIGTSNRETPRRPPGLSASLLSHLGRILVSKAMTFVLAAVALVVGLSTFVILARGSPLGLGAGIGTALVLANISVLLLLGAVLAGRLTRVWVERRRGSAGSQLHVRLVMLFSGVAVAPTILVACFAVAFFHFGIQAWFNDPVRTALAESLQVSRGYLEEHRNTIRSDALEMANDLARAGQFLAADPSVFVNVLDTQTTLRGLTEAVIYEPNTSQ